MLNIIHEVNLPISEVIGNLVRNCFDELGVLNAECRDRRI
jgi:hypothetical protein